MQIFWQEVLRELSTEWPTAEQLARVGVRLLLAVLLTAIIGWEREAGNKTAGLRTHLLVALGSALFVVVAVESMPVADASRVIQGIATGIGFIGGGAILKVEDEKRIRGLTTAGSIWLAAAIGVAAGLGKIGAAILGLVFAWLILSSLESVGRRINARGKKKEAHSKKDFSLTKSET